MRRLFLCALVVPQASGFYHPDHLSGAALSLMLRFKNDAYFKDQENTKPFTELILSNARIWVPVCIFFLSFCSSLMLINLVRKTKERADSDWQAAAAKGGGQRRKLRRRSGKKPFHTQRGGFLKCATGGGRRREPAVRSLWCADEK